jgi:phage terminase large subunit-like protein
VPQQRGGSLRARGKLYPRKSRPEQKIDAAMALIMALGCCISDTDSEAALSEFLANPVFM